jgi:triacylglycerol lipase
VWAAENGMVAVLMGHRILPDHPYPAGQEDVRAALDWIGENADRLGVDTNRVAVMGFSVGGSHLAAFLAGGERFAARVRPDRFVFVSSYHDHQGAPASVHAYFGTDAEEGRTRLSPALLRDRREPMLVVSAELDPPVFVTQADALKAALCEAGRCPTFLRLDGHNHNSGIFSIRTEDRSLSGPLLDFLQAP